MVGLMNVHFYKDYCLLEIQIYLSSKRKMETTGYVYNSG